LKIKEPNILSREKDNNFFLKTGQRDIKLIQVNSQGEHIRKANVFAGMWVGSYRLVYHRKTQISYFIAS
jgi:hypothetical protein